MIHRIFNSKGYWSFASLILLVFACNQAQEPVEKLQNYDTGNISRRHSEINGKKEGKMTEYYPEGPIKTERFFKDGKEEGRTVIYYPDGKIKETQYYADGLKQGGDTIWYEDGQIQFVLEFDKGKKNGYLRKWAPDNSLTFEAKYEMDSLVEVKGKPVRHSIGIAVPTGTSRNSQ